MKLTNPIDTHLHLREGTTLDFVTPFSAKYFSAGVIMPNLLPPICEEKRLLAYEEEILSACKDLNFKPLMTLFYKNYDASFLRQMAKKIFAIKLYPAGVTTNSADGLDNFDIKAMAPTLEAMSELGIPLLVHGESNDFVLDREANFAPIYEKLALAFPDLKISMEHISTKKLAKLLDKHDNLYASITLHHLLITLDDVLGGALQPHLFCKPLAKRKEDKDALLDLALSAHPRVSFGSDSAPHTKEAKLECGCAGVFSAPVILSKLTQLFKQHSNEANLEAFLSKNAIKNFSLKVPNKQILMKEERWQVPSMYGDFVPFLAGCEMEFTPYIKP